LISDHEIGFLPPLINLAVLQFQSSSSVKQAVGVMNPHLERRGGQEHRKPTPLPHNRAALGGAGTADPAFSSLGKRLGRMSMSILSANRTDSSCGERGRPFRRLIGKGEEVGADLF
jgi:hypothetical protein